MTRDILTTRTPTGWAGRAGRITATRDTELRDAVRAGTAIVAGGRTRGWWTVQLLSPDGAEVWDEESVNTLDEADAEAWIFAMRIDDGTDRPDHDPDSE